MTKLTGREEAAKPEPAVHERSGSSIGPSSHSMARTYQDAIRCLNPLRRPKRPEAASQGHKALFRGKPGIYGMSEWLKMLDFPETLLPDAKIIHVAGSKGKGSTCIYTAAFLAARNVSKRKQLKVGLYTKPHLVRITERFRINGEDVKQEDFARDFFHVYEATVKSDPKPRYLQLSFLTALECFRRESVDVAIFETHMGGAYDVTNIVKEPYATAITSIGMDHVEVLGPDLEDIARHKAGIIKPGRPVFTIPQAPAVAEIIEATARECGAELVIVDPAKSRVAQKEFSSEVMAMNAALGLQVAESVIGSPLTDEEINMALQISWPGRFQRIPDGKHNWYLDGAHNEMSVRHAASWFASQLKARAALKYHNTLVFAHISQRNGGELVRILAETLKANGVPMQKLLLTTLREDADLQRPGTYPDFLFEYATDLHIDLINNKGNLVFSAEMQKQYREEWLKVYPDCSISYESNVYDALNFVRHKQQPPGQSNALVVGSLYLIGGALRYLEQIEEKS